MCQFSALCQCAEADQLQSPAAMLASNDQAEPAEQGQMQEVTPLGMLPNSGRWHPNM